MSFDMTNNNAGDVNTNPLAHIGLGINCVYDLSYDTIGS